MKKSAWLGIAGIVGIAGIGAFLAAKYYLGRVKCPDCGSRNFQVLYETHPGSVMLRCLDCNLEWEASTGWHEWRLWGVGE